MASLRSSISVIVSSLVIGIFIVGCQTTPIQSEEILQTESDENSKSSNFGPLDEYMKRIMLLTGLVWEKGSIQEVNAILAANRLRGEEYISACMTEKGFVYFPRTFERVEWVERDAGTFIVQDSREWAERFGFGWTTSDLPRRWESSRELVHRTDPFARLEWQQQVGFEEMSESEVAAWDIAFWGPRQGASIGPNTTRDEAIQTGGCQWLEQFERLQRQRPPSGFESIQHEVEVGFPLLLRGDWRVLQLNTEWFSCMTDAGFSTWRSPSEASEYFYNFMIPFDGAAHVAWDWTNYPEGPQQPNRRDLIELEIEAATRSWDCREVVDYDARLREIDLDLQQLFVDRHRGDLEAWALHAEEQQVRWKN
jgi:hypothetical protein